jgi:hypothetical protein
MLMVSCFTQTSRRTYETALICSMVISFLLILAET